MTKYRAGQLLPWTRPPYGYRLNPDHPRDPTLVHVDEAEAAMVVQIFGWYLEPQTTLYSIAKRLSELFLPTPSGQSRWNVSTVRGILKNPAYTGNAYTNRSRPIPATHRKSALLPIGSGASIASCPVEDWVLIPVPAIVTQEIFDRVQTKLSLNRQMAPRNNKVHRYLLRGLVSCGMCRLSTTARTLPTAYQYYVCRGKTEALRAAQGQRCTSRFIPANQLDDLVWQDLCLVLTQPDILHYALERAHGGHWLPQELRSQLEALQRASQQMEHQQERLLEAYIANVIQLPEFERKRMELSQKQAALHQQQEFQLQATSSQRVALSQVADSIEVFCAKIRPVLELASFEQKRQLVELLIDRVIVLDNDVEIRYVIPTQPEDPHLPFCHLRSDYRNVLALHQIRNGFRGTTLAQVGSTPQIPADCCFGVCFSALFAPQHRFPFRLPRQILPQNWKVEPRNLSSTLSLTSRYFTSLARSSPPFPPFINFGVNHVYFIAPYFAPLVCYTDRGIS